MRFRHPHLTLACAAAFGVAIASPVTAQPVLTYQGACDGSAAIALGANHFAVADDDHNVLRVYRTGELKPVWSLNLDNFLKAPPKKTPGQFKEADIEGAAQIQDRIYWIGSHGRDSDGNAEPGRARLFATRITAQQNEPRLEAIGREPFQKLREAMFADAALARLNLADAYAPGKEKNGPAPESDNGFNIEGLASTADGRLLVGFRNPRPKNRAVVIQIDNPADVVEKQSPPIFGKTILLDLKGRGIRSIERVGSRYVIVAGPHQAARESAIKPPFALFIWNGSEDNRDPTEIEVAMPSDFSPEALFVSPDGSTMTLLSDDGDLNNCKKADEAKRSFRALTVAAPK